MPSFGPLAMVGLCLLGGSSAFRPHALQQVSGSTAQRVRQVKGRTMVARAPQEFSRNKAKREMMERQRAMAEFQAGIETTPVFQVFAASEKMRGLWMPVAAFKADNVAKGVVDAYIAEGFMANMFKNVYKAQIESAVAKSIFDNERKLREQGQAMHATLKNLPRDSTVWGFKILYKPYEEKVGKNLQPTPVTKDMAKSVFDKFKDAVSTNVKETFNLSFMDQSEPAKPESSQPSKPKTSKKKKNKDNKAEQ